MRNGQNDQKTLNCVKDFFIKLTNTCKKNKNKMFYIFAGIMSLAPDSELYNFITS